MSAVEAALHYARAGLTPIPVPHRGKNPGRRSAGGYGTGWQDARVGPGDVPRHFPPGKPRNVGVLLGAPSAGLVDVDLDCPEAVRLADALLPPTGAVFGRPSKPRSHRLYAADPVPAATEQFQFTKGEMLVELRSSGGQTVFPGSTHESGEAIAWDAGRDGVPAPADGPALRDAVADVAAGALLVRHYPDKGGRHNFALALASILLRSGRSVRNTEVFVRAVATVAGDEEVDDRVGCVASTEKRLRAGGKATGVPTLKELVGADPASKALGFLGVGELMDVAGDAVADGADVRVSDAPPPDAAAGSAEPARRWPEPLGPDAYHGLAGDVVRAIEPHTEADPVAVLLHLLAGVGNVIGREVHFRVGGATHPLNLFVACVGRTSKGRKGTAQADTFQFVRQADGDWATGRVQTGLSSGEGLIWAVRDEIRQCVRDRKTGEVEEVVVDPGVDDKRLLVVEPELASVLKRMGREANTLSAVLRLAWDGLDLRVLTKNSPAVATRPHVSVIGHITEDELRRELAGTEAANGFANRFLWTCVGRSKLLPEGGALDTVDVADLVARLRKAVDYARRSKVIGVLTRDPAARELWAAVYPELSAGRSGLFGAVTSRAEAQVMRLAGLYAVLDCSAIVTPEHLLAGLAVWRYAEQSARYIFGGSLGDHVADEILAALRRSPEGLTRTDIGRLFSGHRDAGQVGRALGVLVREGLARCRPISTGGRPAEQWFAVRLDAGKAA
ncbi:MAG TPA: bifunctional DNA primase/polymerase [Humisphaera sp.]